MTSRKKVSLPVVVRTRSEGQASMLLISASVQSHGEDEYDALHEFKRSPVNLEYREIEGRLWMPTNGRKGIIRRRFAHLMTAARPRDVLDQAYRIIALGVAQHPHIHDAIPVAQWRLMDRREEEDGWSGLARQRAPEIEERFCLVGDRIWCRSHGPMLMLRDGPGGPRGRWAGGSTIVGGKHEIALPLSLLAEFGDWLRSEWPGIAAKVPANLPEWHRSADDDLVFQQAERFVWTRLKEIIETGALDRAGAQCLAEARRVIPGRWDDIGMPYPWQEPEDWHLHGRTLLPPDDLVPLIGMMTERDRGLDRPFGDLEGKLLLQVIAAWSRRAAAQADVLAAFDLPTAVGP